MLIPFYTVNQQIDLAYKSLRKTFQHLFCLLVVMAGLRHLSTGQDFLPALNDNFMGINQAFLQPASIADSRFRIDFNVAGFSNDIYNDAIRFRSKWLLDPTSILTNEDWWDENTYISDKNGRDDIVFMSQSGIGPSFLATLSPKHSIGFTSRVRSILNIDNMDEPLFRTEPSNMDLSLKREESTAKYLFNKKVNPGQLLLESHGESQPVDNNVTPEGRQRNRRVEMELIE